MRGSIGIQARSLVRTGLKRPRQHRPTIAGVALTNTIPHSNALASKCCQNVTFPRSFSTSQVETHSLTEPPIKSNAEMAREDAVRSIDRHCENKAPEQAEEVLRRMEDKNLFLSPKEYTKVLKCYVNLNMLDRAHSLLLTMKQTPGRDCFPLVANALIQSNKLSKAKELLYNHMDRGIAITVFFNTLISAYIHQNRRRQAVALVHKMDLYARKGYPEARPDKMTLTPLMQKLASRGHSRDAKALLERMWQSPDKDMQPDAVTYSLVFTAYANANNVDADDAHELLQTMKKRFEASGDLSTRPNTVVYNSFLSVLARAGDGERAEQVLKEMESSDDFLPDNISYRAVLTAWKNACRGDKAEALFWKMPNPDRLCFKATIAALGQQGEPKRAEALLRHMTLQNLEPDSSTFTAILNAWANAKDDPEAFENAKSVLLQMSERGDVIDTAVYNTFLKAIENAFMLDNKLHAVKSVLMRMTRSTNSQPNNATYRQAILAVGATKGDERLLRKALEFCFQLYKDRQKDLPWEQQKVHAAAMLEACGKLSPHGIHGGDDIVNKVFSACCDEGIVTSLHTRLLVKAASDDLLKKIYNVDTLDQRILHIFPKRWGRKIRKQGRRRNRKR